MWPRTSSRRPARRRPAATRTRPPVVGKAVEPVYPPEALAARAAADVTMVVDLDAAGRVTAVAVARPVGHGFDEAAQAAMLRYLFSPAEVDGKPAPISIEYTLHFLPGTAAPAPDPERAGPETKAGAPPAPAPAPPAVVAAGVIREKGTREPQA